MSELIVVSVAPNHPSGQRNRAGFRFSPTPSVAEVTEEQRQTIKEDKYLNVHRRLSMAWFKAFGIDRTEANEKAYAKADPENWAATANVALKVEESTAVAVPQQEGGGAPGSGADSVVPEVGMTSSKDAVVAALVALELKPDVDFDPAAGRNALLAVYKDAVEKKKLAAAK